MAKRSLRGKRNESPLAGTIPAQRGKEELRAAENSAAGSGGKKSSAQRETMGSGKVVYFKMYSGAQ